MSLLVNSQQIWPPPAVRGLPAVSVPISDVFVLHRNLSRLSLLHPHYFFVQSPELLCCFLFDILTLLIASLFVLFASLCCSLSDVNVSNVFIAVAGNFKTKH